ncbi:hypothetical protein GGR56DRAFT_414022 [Xylariaceae sp. FL0804]|nr:hypothetical protein GGR56DRAFT_414022 [Xylariaceae sp. FL0804]
MPSFGAHILLLHPCTLADCSAFERGGQAAGCARAARVWLEAHQCSARKPESPIAATSLQSAYAAEAASLPARPSTIEILRRVSGRWPRRPAITRSSLNLVLHPRPRHHGQWQAAELALPHPSTHSHGPCGKPQASTSLAGAAVALEPGIGGRLLCLQPHSWLAAEVHYSRHEQKHAITPPL